MRPRSAWQPSHSGARAPCACIALHSQPSGLSRPFRCHLLQDGTTSGADPTLALLLRSASSGQPLRQWNPTEPGGAAEAACARALAWLSTVNLRLQSWLAAMQTYCPPSLRLAEHIPQGTLWLALGLFRSVQRGFPTLSAPPQLC